MRVLHAPLNIANDAWSLSRGQRAIGVDADVAALTWSRYVAAPDIDLRFEDRGRLSRQLAKVAFVRRALREYDVFHYSFASSIFDYSDGAFALRDLKRAHMLGKCVAMTFHGCDVRPAQPGGCALCDAGCSKERATSRLATIRQKADLLYVTTPDLLLAVPEASLLPQSVWGLAEVTPVPPSAEGPLRVVHAPTDRVSKGSAAVIEAVAALQAEGVNIELALIENVDRERALELYRSADVAVDQLKAGWYGVFAVELMAMGKPVVGHISPRFVELSGMDAPPIVDATETSIADVLRDLAARRAELPTLGEASRVFARARHDAEGNARRVVKDYVNACGERAGTLSQAAREEGTG